MSKWMIDPQCYKMIRDKPDGIKIGRLSFPFLNNNEIYLLPKEDGDILIKEGFAILVIPKSSIQQQMEEQLNAKR